MLWLPDKRIARAPAYILGNGFFGGHGGGAPAFADDYAYETDGVNEYFHHADLWRKQLNESWCVEIILDPVAVTGSRYYFNNQESSGNNGLLWGIHNGNWFMEAYSTGPWAYREFGAASTSGGYDHTVWGWSAATGFKFWLNGSAVAASSTPGTGSPTMSFNAVTSILRRNNSTGYVAGKLRHATFWNKLFSDAEVTELYNGGTTLNPTTHSAAADLAHYYTFGDDAADDATTVHDQTGGKDLTYNNGEAGDKVPV